NDWRANLRAQTNNDLAFAIAHERHTKVFERALDQDEDTLAEVEDDLKDQPEDGLADLEKVIKRGEKPTMEHSERMRLHSTRMALHSIRMKVHSTRMSLHSQRMKFHSTRMGFHSDRMKSHTVVFEAMAAELKAALVAEGLIGATEEFFHLKVTNGEVHLNRRPLANPELSRKYRAILARYGMDKEGLIFHLHENGRSLSTERR
ncbi:MAG: hypothetical protein AAFZ52_15115, partial [Bacteroidota bacterium]